MEREQRYLYLFLISFGNDAGARWVTPAGAAATCEEEARRCLIGQLVAAGFTAKRLELMAKESI